jgi:hypothetical protein
MGWIQLADTWPQAGLLAYGATALVAAGHAVSPLTTQPVPQAQQHLSKGQHVGWRPQAECRCAEVRLLRRRQHPTADVPDGLCTQLVTIDMQSADMTLDS